MISIPILPWDKTGRLQMATKRKDGIMLDTDAEGFGCAILAAFATMLTVGSYAFYYCLWAFWGVLAPWYLAIIGGLFAGGLAIPIAIVLWILQQCGVHVPVWPQQ